MANEAKQTDHLEIAIGSLLLIVARCEEQQFNPFATWVRHTAMTALNEIYGEDTLKSVMEEVARRQGIE